MDRQRDEKKNVRREESEVMGEMKDGRGKTMGRKKGGIKERHDCEKV